MSHNRYLLILAVVAFLGLWLSLTGCSRPIPAHDWAAEL